LSLHPFIHSFITFIDYIHSSIPFISSIPIHNPHLIQEAATDRATTLRARAADYLLLALELFETPALEKYAHTIRHWLLALWWFSCAHHPNSDCILVPHAKPNIRVI
jgi:hypothetical protein